MDFVDSKITFINHASMLIETHDNKILTDPWYISPAFGTWHQYPFPQYEDIKKIVENDDSMLTVISHGHDDHLDDFFIKSYLKKTQIIISKFTSKGLLRRVARLVDKEPIEIEQDFEKPVKIKNTSLYSFSNEHVPNDSIILISSDNELIIHANDNYREQPEEIIENIIKISQNKKIYYFSQVGCASSFPTCFPNIPLHIKKEVIRSEHERFMSAFEKNIEKIKPDLAFTYANQFYFENSDDLSYYDDVQELVDSHSFIKQLFPGDQIIDGELFRNKNSNISVFEKLLKDLENLTNEYINSKIQTNFKFYFKTYKGRKNREILSPKTNEIYFVAEVATWLDIITGKLNLETILIGGIGDIIKVHEETMREVAIYICEFSYIYQNRITENLFTWKNISKI